MRDEWGLYIHLPWCVRKCPYCDFNSHRAPEHIPEMRYVTALCHEMEQASPRFRNRQLVSIFLGGGTPSLFSPEAIERILKQARVSFPMTTDAEITLEANPGTAEAERFKGYRSVGVTRLSLGVQSFDDERLRALGRIHTAEQARAAYRMGRDAKFLALNIDLMYGLPGQTLAGAQRDLAEALDFAPEHLSYYQLTLEAGTPFFHNPPTRPDDTVLARIEMDASARFAATGYERYEVSAYSKGIWNTCRHNLGYWRYGDYLGIGAGAHSKLRNSNGIWRQVRTRFPAGYLAAIEANQTGYEEWRLEHDEIRFEFFLNTLRLREGFSPNLFQQQTGENLATVAETLQELADLGLLEVSEHNIRTTQRGYAILDDVVAFFLPTQATGMIWPQACPA
ncbi:MAG: radical SAM family heme chaperone HemW [Gammaproteobacteria bacterium]